MRNARTVSDVYDDLLMQHIKNARNYRTMPTADLRIEGVNPLCGDSLELFLRWDAERAADLSFQCTCCGISMASTSVLTEILLGRTRAEMVAACDRFVGLIDADNEAGAEALTPDQQAVLNAARAYPARARCAALAWRTVRDALQPATNALSRAPKP